MSEQLDEATLKGYRKAHQAALYANLRSLIAWTLLEENPAIGLHAVVVFESGGYTEVQSGATPEIPRLFSMLAFLQGKAIERSMARAMGDMKNAGVGDRFNPELGTTQCIGCEDGDPDGSHAAAELRENGKAWLGVVIEVAERFYGEHLSEKAKALLAELKAEALPANASVS